MRWETEQPIKVEVDIVHQCHPTERQTTLIGNPFQQVALAMLEQTDTAPFQIAQALSSVTTFWTQVASGDRKPEEFDKRFESKRRRWKEDEDAE